MPLHRRFKSGTDWEPIGFFSDSLCEAKTFDLMLGFFSSSAINILSDGFAAFLYNGGKMRMIINDILSEEDKEAIIVGKESVDIPFFDLSNLESIKDTLSERDTHFFECLSYLIRNDRLEIKIISPRENKGISHTKTGIFDDGKNRIAFEGSCNFSRTALVDNIESFTVTCDWDGPIAMANIDEIERDFEETFTGNNNCVDYKSADKIKTCIVDCFDDKDVKQLVEEEFKQLKNREKLVLPMSIRKALERAKCHVSNLLYKSTGDIEVLLNDEEPCFPYASGPRDYQILAFENWKSNRQKGLFAMATGTGKTITSLNCLLEIYKRKGYYKAIILVPTITLVNQWEQECRKFNFSNIIKVYSKNFSWRDEIERIRFNEKYKAEKDTEISFIIISTYASYSREKVFKELNSFDKKRLLMIADECHNMGSGSLAKHLKEIPYLRRIGLSATPERQYDDNGNRELKKFFGSEERYTYEYSMKEAIENGVLCRYMYYPHIVELTTEEMNSYIELSEKISKYFNYNTCNFDEPDEMLKRLLLARKRIIHKAANKLKVFKNIIRKRFEERGDLKYSLIYVPEGNMPDYIGSQDDFDKTENIGEDNDAEHLIDQYTLAVTEIDEKVTVRKFVSGQRDREEVLADFASGKLHVLTSMKCLDEGVDVPRSELAIFCSSTGNPRQFIQRRGRVLRTHPDKKMAELHDLVVIPKVKLNSNSYKMEQSLLKGELIRVNNFALLSENPSYSEVELREVLDHYALNLYNNDYIQ